MKYFIGKVSEQDVESFGSDGLYEHEGTYYYNMVEFGSNPGGVDDFVINDTCGRSIPVSTDMINPLIGALLDIRCTLHAIESTQELQECLEDSNCIHTFE